MLNLNHSEFDIPDCYSWIWDFIIKPVQKKAEIPVDIVDEMGGRCSGKTMMFCPILWVTLCDYCDPDSFEFLAFRSSVGNAKALQNDILSVLGAYNVSCKSTRSYQDLTITYKGNKMRIYGLNSQKRNNVSEKAGLPRAGDVRYCFVFFEERYEFSENQISLIKQAIRSINKKDYKTQYIYISACNPWAKSHEYIDELLSKQPFNIDKMKTDGSQIGIYDNEDTIKGKDGELIKLKQKQIIQYTNWRVVQKYLSDDQISIIKQTHLISKSKGMTVDYGYPGYESGGIYTEFLNKLTQSMYIPHEFLFGGVDYGWGRAKQSGKTVALFMGASIDAGIDIYGEYSHSNADVAIDADMEADNIVRFYVEQMNQYMRKTSDTINGRPREVVVRVDRAEPAFITILNSKVAYYNVYWLRFIKSKKFEVPERIMVTISLLAQSKLRINENTLSYPVKLLRSEFEYAKYEEDQKTQMRAKKNDHSINAFEYAIEPLMTVYEADLKKRIGTTGKWY